MLFFSHKLYIYIYYIIKPSTHVDENRELTIGVSERQIRG